MTIKMGADTWDALSAKELSGFKATVTGRLKVDGSLGSLSKFDKQFVSKYLETSKPDMKKVN